MNKPYYFEDVPVGAGPEPLIKGPLTPMHLMRWSAAMENWHRIHYDRTFTIEHEKLPDLLINGSLKQQFLLQMLKDWAGAGGWVWKVGFQFRGMNTVGDTLTCWAEVERKTECAEFGVVDLRLGIRGADGSENTPGTARVALPYRTGKPLPYPFVPPQVPGDR